MNCPPKTFSSRRLPLLVAFGVLGIGLAVTAVVTAVLAREARVQDAARFDRIIHDTQQLLETRVERYEAGLAGLQEFFSARKTVTEAEWELRLDRFAPKINYPGLIEVGYAHFLEANRQQEPPERAMISPSEEAAAADSTLQSNNRSWRVLFHYCLEGWPGFTYGEGLQPRYVEDWRNDTAPRSYKGDAPAASRKRVLESRALRKKTSVFTLYLPVYRTELSSEASLLLSGKFNERQDARQNHMKGLVFASISADDLFDKLFGKQPRAVEFELFSSPKPAREQWLNDRSAVMRFGDPTHHP
jgi:hypothetical protein